jgi:pyruvate/2-oxoglutarate dehydrogenase complex dihydrolipoamide acyltransferase (E2) component
MPTDVIMPKLGESITEGTILEWKKNIGDKIDRDETLLEISTDKVDSEIPSPASGKILEILYQVNDVVDVGTIIARIGSETEPVTTPVDESSKENEKTQNAQVEKTISKSEQIKGDLNKEKELNIKSLPFYSPLVKSIASKEGIDLLDLESINGTGHNGRVNKSDILSYIDNQKSKSNDNDSSNSFSTNNTEPMGHMRKMIATHMQKSRDTSVHVYSTSEVDITSIVNFRNKNKDAFISKYQTSLTYTPFFIDSVIKAINEFPLINANILDDKTNHNANINIGVAVALPDNNLIVPVIKRSEEFNFLGLARSTADYANRARIGKLQPSEVKDSTFTITNPGIFGSLFGMGIINQPNVGLLSIGSIHKRPVVKETDFGDIVVVRSMVYLTLAYDHRLIDGAYGTQFLSKVKDLLENFSTNEIKI